jgi:hypothetical protein
VSPNLLGITINSTLGINPELWIRFHCYCAPVATRKVYRTVILAFRNAVTYA